MPTSNLALWPWILNLVETVEPSPLHVLDVGPGHGKAAVLLREYLNHPPSRIDAVEAHKPYVDAFGLTQLYDEVYIGDVQGLHDSLLAAYDLVLMADVIEHIEKDQALALLDRIPGRVVISTPVEFFSNGPGLPDSETHRSHWTATDWNAQVTRRPVEACFEQLGGWVVRLGRIGAPR